MNTSGPGFPDRKTWRSVVSPSNLAMAALVGFLFVGQATDWRILGHQANANPSASFGKSVARGNATGTVVPLAGQVRTGVQRHSVSSIRSDKTGVSEEVADRRSAPRQGQPPQSEVD